MGIFNPGTYMSSDDKDQAKKRGTPILLAMLGALFVLIGLSLAPEGLILSAFGALSLGVAILAMKQQAAADALAIKRRAEDAEIRAHRLRQARGGQ